MTQRDGQIGGKMFVVRYMMLASYVVRDMAAGLMTLTIHIINCHCHDTPSW